MSQTKRYYAGQATGVLRENSDRFAHGFDRILEKGVKAKLAGRKIGFALFIVLAVALILVGVMVRHHVFSRSERDPVVSSTILKLPFTIPCAIDSHDADPVYGAFRKRDRELLQTLFANKKFIAVQKGIEVRIASFGAVSMLLVEGRSPRGSEVCFVPAYVVPVIRQHASH